MGVESDLGNEHFSSKLINNGMCAKCVYFLIDIIVTNICRAIKFYQLLVYLLERITILGLLLNIIGSIFLVKSIVGKKPAITAKESSLDMVPLLGDHRILNPILLKGSIILKWNAYTGLVFIILGLLLQILGNLTIVPESYMRIFFIVSLLFSFIVLAVHFLLKEKYYLKILKRSLLAYHAEYHLMLGDKKIVDLLIMIFGEAFTKMLPKERINFLADETKKAGFKLKQK